MQRSLTPILAGCVAVAALVFAAPKPASATMGCCTGHPLW